MDQSYWDQGYQDLQPTMAPSTDQVRQWLEASVPTANGDKHCLEVGCYPGHYLAVLGGMGYVVHGIDLTPAIDRMAPAFAAQGMQVGEFRRLDFLKDPIGRRYDVVCSFGFIEHFPNWQDVLRKHAELVEPGGLIVIETPNFRGFVQQLLHRSLDGDATNLRRHHIPAMAPRKWAKVLQAEGFEVLTHGYLGKFQFWTDSPPFNYLQQKLYNRVVALTPRLERVRPGGASLSPYCVLIARRPVRSINKD